MSNSQLNLRAANIMKRITRKPPRYSADNAQYFLTFCTDKRLPILHRPGVPEMLVDNLLFYGKRLRSIIAYTIMPEHVHLIVEVSTVKSLSDFLRDFKKRTSKEIKRMLSLQRSHVWQRGTMDHCIRISWESSDFHRHLQYLFYNSWKHLKIVPRNFPYHNFAEVVQRGLMQINFCDFEEKSFRGGKLHD